MEDLTNLHCARIGKDTPCLNKVEITDLLGRVQGWDMYEKDGEPRLEKSYKFKDFNQAMAFTNRIAQEADKEDHHPALLTEWGKVTVTWWTHRINGLHLNDFIMAARTDKLFNDAG